MSYMNAKAPAEVYHLTKKKNLPAILQEKTIKRFSDQECWFCESLPKLKHYMEYTVLQEGKLFYDVGGVPNHYPKFIPEDYVVLKLIPEGRKDRWVRWMQEVPIYVDQAFKDKATEFSNLKIGYRGNLRFSDYEVLSVGDVLMGDEQVWRAKAEQRRNEYPPKTRIEIQRVGTSAYHLLSGTRGTVEDVDSIGYLHVTWDDGRKLPINPDTDFFRVLSPDECYEERSEKLQSAFIDSVNDHVIPMIDLQKLGEAYENKDMTYPTEILKMLHTEFLNVYGTDKINSDLADFVMVPGVVLGANQKIYIALLELDLSSSGEHWNTQFFTPHGIYTQITDEPNQAAKRYLQDAVPYRYWYTVQYGGDIHVDWNGCPDEINEMIDQALEEDHRMEGGMNYCQ